MGQYFTNEKLPSRRKKFSTHICGKHYSFITDLGVFSKDSIDFGTRVLLEHLPYSTFSSPILDVGCGYGVIGIVVSNETGCSVTMVDVNLRALHLARENALLNHQDQMRILESNCYDGLDSEEKFAVIITNPPIRAGKEIVYRILQDARKYLKEDGELYFVVRKEQGAKTILRDLEKIYEIYVLDKIKGFFIVRCRIRLTS